MSRVDTYQSALRIDSRSMEVERIDLALRGVFDAVPSLAPVYEPVRLSLAEAVNNVIEHAYQSEPGHHIDLEFEANAASIRIAISDKGQPAPKGLWDNIALPEFDIADVRTVPEGGFGLFIIKSHMDEVHYETCGGVNTLTLVKRIDTGT